MRVDETNGISDQVEYEQGRVDAAYAIGDAVLQKLGKPMQAANQSAAQKLQKQRHARAQQLEGVLEDDTSLMVRGRVDFVEGSAPTEGGGRTYYVGIVHLSDYSEDDPQVVGWESDRAAAWREPTHGDGVDVARKLTFEGRDRRLTDIIEARYRNGALEPGSEDPLLTRLARSSSGELTDVVATIQSDQWDLMARDPRRNMVVQGAPGTGKTIVGLHRVSVMLFRSEGEMTESDVLVVGPSDVFLRYIRDLLPSLGRGGVQQLKIADVGRPADVRVRGADTMPARRVKGRSIMVEVLKRYLDQRVGADIKPDEIDPSLSLSVGQVQQALRRARERDATSYNDLRARVRQNLLEAAVGKGEQAQADYRRRRADALDNLLNRLIPSLSPMEALQSLLSGPKLLAAAAADLLDAADQAAIRREPAPLRQVEWTVDDIPLLDELDVLLNGRNHSYPYHHIVVDEAQDLSPMQLRALRRRSTGGMTILGDLAQATSPWAPTTWEGHLAEAGIQIDDLEELTDGYRTVRPIVDFTNRLLPIINVDVPEATAIVAEGDEPVLCHEPDVETLAARAVDFASSIVMDDENPGSVGIIGDREELDEVARHLKDLRGEDAITWDWADDTLKSPVTLVPADEAKGLEFDHVIVLEPSGLYARDPVTGPRLLYVAMSRAQHGLSLIHIQRLPAALQPRPEAPVEDDLIPSGPIADVAPPAPEEFTSEMPSAPVEDAPVHAASTGWTFLQPVDGKTVLIRLTGDQAVVERLPDGAGHPVTLARGYVTRADGRLAWALTTKDDVVALVTPDNAAEASAMLVAQLRH